MTVGAKAVWLLLLCLTLGAGIKLPKKRLAAPSRALAGQLMARPAVVVVPVPAKTNLTFTWTPMGPVGANLQMTRDFRSWSNVIAVDTSKGTVTLTNALRQFPFAFYRIAAPYR